MQNNTNKTYSQHKELHMKCDTVIIGDTTCCTILPSKRDSLLLLTYAGITIDGLACEIHKFQTKPTIQDVCLQVGTHDITRNTRPHHLSNLIEDYHNLIEVTKDVFPNAYITIYGLLPKISNSRIEHCIIQLSADLKHLCKDYRYVKYVDMISHFTTCNGLINLKYYDDQGFLLKNWVAYMPERSY